MDGYHHNFTIGSWESLISSWSKVAAQISNMMFAIGGRIGEGKGGGYVYSCVKFLKIKKCLVINSITIIIIIISLYQKWY